nr:TRAP transporter small permease subunit [Rhodovulum imhoffii]
MSEFVGRAISGLSLVLIVILLIEIVARYFLDSPTIWAHELSTMLFGAFCMLAGCYALRHHSHVRSEVIYGILSSRIQALCDTIVFGLGLVVLAVFFRMAVEFAADSWEMREFSARSVWQPPLYPVKTVIPIAVGLLFLQNLAEFLRSVLRTFGVRFNDPRAPEDEILAETHLPETMH